MGKFLKLTVVLVKLQWGGIFSSTKPSLTTVAPGKLSHVGPTQGKHT